MTQDRILLSEWAPTSQPVPLGHQFGRSPCPVCGHPTGDCTTDHTTEARIIMAEQSKAKGAAGAKDKDELQTDAAPAPAAPADDEAVLVKRGEGSVNDGLFEKTEAGEELVTLGRDVVEEFYYPGTKRPAYRVLFTKGQVVRRSAIEQYNSALEGPDESNPLGIDSSTLASGTRVEPVKDDEGK